MNLFIDLITFERESAQNPFEEARALGIKWASSEQQLIAEQIKLTGCTLPDGLTEANFPNWLRRGR
ncbi:MULTISPECIES: hypothetical protein [Brucella]|uniref:Uncharacterized protein n=1 Tax=Brucella haematophila TaxID=419474 RepID=A0ABX1DHI1_9HYPH|nr:MULTISPECIES: hypothetical protein [Brucella]KAB2752337.1 hypothetical protein F9L05_04280 [Brucella anthropi]KAB2776507.1 hypothetical protein F9L00_14320 [Brucella anthropi]NKC02444.1 hypothetical protein [Brucella haematophila]TMV03092.1 hypothetical protein FGI60_11790 [Brucella haematophila]